jgi:Phosphoadenosine phosphosulfate reductase family
MRRIVVGFSGGVTSAWCAGWALRNYPREEVILLWHDTKEEDPDTYRFLREMASALGVPITERSDGRSVTQVAEDHGSLPNDLMAFCSEDLKQIPANNFIKELQERGATEIVRIMGFSAKEVTRMQRHTAMCWQQSGLFCSVTVRFPLAEEMVTKQDAWNWCNCTMGIAPPEMYKWSDHANCPGCFRGGRAYWLAVKDHRPLIFEQRKMMEKESGFTIINGISLDELEKTGLKRKVNRKESIEIGPCECGS